MEGDDPHSDPGGNPPIGIATSSSRPPAGNLQRYLSGWEAISSNKFVLNIIKDGYKIQLNCNLDHIEVPNKRNINIREDHPLIIEINNLLGINAISKCSNIKGNWFSHVFIVEKNSSGHRLVINLKNLNNFVVKSHFRMEDKKSIMALIDKEVFMVSIDLKDAFFSVPLHKDSQMLTCFIVNNVTYHYNVLPFGLSSSPRIFTKLMNEVILYLRSKGVTISAYLDDIFLSSPSKETLIEHTELTIDTLQSLGFTINQSKSSLTPSKNLTHLGFVWNSSSMDISLPLDKVRKIANFANKLRTRQCSIRDLASFIGIAVSSKDGFYYAPLFYRNLQFNLNKLRNKEENWDAYAQLTPESLQDLSWWEKLEDHDLKPVQINPPDHNISVFTDASKTGWGASIQGGKSYSGKWSNYEQNQHINWLELKAVQLTVL